MLGMGCLANPSTIRTVKHSDIVKPSAKATCMTNCCGLLWPLSPPTCLPISSSQATCQVHAVVYRHATMTYHQQPRRIPALRASAISWDPAADVDDVGGNNDVD